MKTLATVVTIKVQCESINRREVLIFLFEYDSKGSETWLFWYIFL